MMLWLSSNAYAKIEAVWSTNAALPGEKVVLFIMQSNKNSASPARIRLATPGKVKNGQIIQQRASLDTYFKGEDPHQNNGLIEGFFFVIEAGGSGKVECEDFEVTLSTGRKEKVTVPPLDVYTTAKVTWRTIEGMKGDAPATFGTMWLYSPEEYYAGQPVHATVKLLLPQNYNRRDQEPQVTAQAVTAGTFRTPLEDSVPGTLLQQIYPIRNRLVKARGQNWIVEDLEVTLIPETAGKTQEAAYDVYVKIPCLFITVETVTHSSPGSFFQSTSSMPTQHTIELPKLQLPKPRPLPPNPPADFSDLVGSFKISTQTEAKDLAMNEMVDVEITITGNGSLEMLSCPQPEEADQWKLMPPTRKLVYSPTGEIQAVVFSQLMRPNAEVSGIPSFTFSYFDAETEEYKTAASAPIGLPWRTTETMGSGQVTAASAAPPAGTVPVAELADIYHFMPNETEGGKGAGIRLPRELWYLLYAPSIGIFLWLIGKALYRHHKSGAEKRSKEKILAILAAEKDNAAFLKGVGAFIESNLASQSMNPELQAILDKRDAEVFRPDGRPFISTEERSGMLKTVRKALARVAAWALLLLVVSAAPAEAEDKAMKQYESGQFSQALETLKEEEKADTQTRDRGDLLYNMGNCLYRLKQPGEAALYYARALQASPGLAEAKANLAFIQRKEGAILPQQKGIEQAFTYLSESQLWLAGVICSAILLFSIALSLLLREKLRLTLRTISGISLFLCLLCLANYIYYATRSIPDLTATPPHELAYITQSTAARSAATDTAEKVIDLPASTPVRVLATRGHFSYVETFVGDRGWIPANTATLLVPQKQAKHPITITFE